ncbi:hypothetical protein GCM10009119_08910 [Algoriphagus jejuensis]|uniref:DUF998 domain-containing protein n=1 Tax=Algoriphagus jejuensis TaxID=419934 RepID=A0ABN1MWV3_9BACT
MTSINSKNTAGILGLLAVAIFLGSLVFFGIANREFSFWDDFISRLGAKGAPNALVWNLIGFVVVGILLFGFGLCYGLLLRDRLLAVLLSFFGLGFAFIASPVDFSDSEVSKVHVLAVCLGLACWLLGLSRMGYNPQLSQKIRNRANVTAVLLLAAITGHVLGGWAMPMTHRLVFGIVFGWTAITSLELLLVKESSDQKTT